MRSAISRSALFTTAVVEARSVAARFRALDRAGSGTVTRWPIAAGTLTALFVAVAWSFLGRDGRLSPETVSTHGWSAAAVGRGDLRRTVSATLMAPTPQALIAIAAGNAVPLYLLERLIGHGPALGLWALGSVGGFLVSTGAISVAARTGWPVARRALHTLDFGPSLGTTTTAAALVLLMRQRSVTVTVIGGLIVISVAHRDIADALHLIVLASALLAGEAFLRSRRGGNEAIRIN